MKKPLCKRVQVTRERENKRMYKTNTEEVATLLTLGILKLGE